MTLRGVLHRLLGGEGLPDGFTGRLGADERVLAVARTVDGTHLVVTSWGLWVPDPPSDAGGHRRIGWHLVSHATWRTGSLSTTTAEASGTWVGL